MDLVGNYFYTFDDFELQPSRRALMRAGTRVSIAPKTFEVLLCLVTNARRVVLKGDLLKSVWPGSFVEESNLTQHIFWLRRALADKAHYIVTIPGRGYEFTGEVQIVPDPNAAGPPIGPVPTLRFQHGIERTHVLIEETTAVLAPATALPALPKPFALRSPWFAAAATGLLAGLAWATWRFHHRVPPGDHHEIVLANFENTTGDPAFTHTLDTLLAIDLNQSPYLAVASSEDTRQVLKLMDKPPDDPLIPPVAREVCQRIGDQAVLTGTIANIGSKYLVTLSATDCQTGKTLVQQKATANDREAVIQAVDTVAAAMHERLGESLKSHSPAQPLQLAHTFSLDALRAYSQAQDFNASGRSPEAIPLFQRAIELDPRFAAAWFELARTYGKAGEDTLSRETAVKAYSLRDQGDDFLRLKIISFYNLTVTGDLHARLANYLTWTEMYPNQPEPWRDLAGLQMLLGRPDLAVEPARRSLALAPNNGWAYVTLCDVYYRLERLEEAKSICRQAIDRRIDDTAIPGILYAIAFYQRDSATMDQMLARRKALGQEDDLRLYSLFAEGKAREAVALWLRKCDRTRTEEGFPEHADRLYRVLLRREADYNLDALLRRQLATIDQTKYPQNIVFANAELGRVPAAEAALKLLDAQPVIGTFEKEIDFPSARAAIALARHQPEQAIADLEIAHPYDAVSQEQVLLRGGAYLAARQPQRAAAEYQKIVDHAYETATTQLHPLAHLGLARALEMQGNHAAARQEYETLFTLWKDADTDLPPLLQAQAEYARIK